MCGTPVLARRNGMSYELRCSGCEWGCATTYPHPFHADQTVYRLIITGLGPDPGKCLVYLNSRMNMGIVRIRNMAKAGEFLFLQGHAEKVWTEAKTMRAQGIAYRVDLPFPYELDDPTLDRSFSEDWRPIGPQSETPKQN
jgi:hypothetical protein